MSDNRIIEVVNAGIDWLTATLPVEASMSADWYGRGLRYLQYIQKQGYELKERSLLGYTGLSCGNCFVGARDSDYICQWTGYHADDGFDAIYRPDMHISRIDVQVTVKYAVMPLTIAREAYRDAITSNEALPNTRRRKLFIIIGSDGGDTFYLGSASSDQRGRIYNKEVQSEDVTYLRTWRYETVFRNNHATSISGHIYTHSSNKAQICADICAKWFTARGVACAWHNNDNALPIPLVRTLPTDIERKLHWLEMQVKPTIKLLCELGFRDILLASLGLSEEV